MTLKRGRIAPCLWFSSEAEEAAEFYVSVFPNSSLGKVARFGEEGQDIHGRAKGSAMTVEFQLDGVPFTALNGGPMFTFNEAVSLQIFCKSQEEVDHFWGQLTEGGDRTAQQCGWLKDRFGVSWQVIPEGLDEYLGGADTAGAQRAMQALLGMKKLDISALQRAYAGQAV